MTEFTYKTGYTHFHIWKTLQARYVEEYEGRFWWKRKVYGVVVLQKCQQCGQLGEKQLSGYFDEVDGVRVKDPHLAFFGPNGEKGQEQYLWKIN